MLMKKFKLNFWWKYFLKITISNLP